MSILVLLATFNGEKYLKEQIDSIINCEAPFPYLAIRDDGSTDYTLELIDEAKKKYPSRVSIVDIHSESSGHVTNFGFLSEYALSTNHRYFCFADQDDVWHKDKIKKMHQRMVELEKKHGIETPILIHSDLRVVDENLCEIAPSFIQFQGLPAPEFHDFPTFLFQNVVTGCATFFNIALLNLAAPIPHSVMNHDWWFGMCAKLYGVLDYLPTPLVNYRQHGDNSIGATHINEQRSYINLYKYKALFEFPGHLSKSIEQAKSLELIAKSNNLIKDQESFEHVMRYAQIKSLPLLQRANLSPIITKNVRAPVETLFIKLSLIACKWLK